jgi:hypothetical protein
MSRQPSVIREHQFIGMALDYFCFGLQPFIASMADSAGVLRALDILEDTERMCPWSI